MKFEKKEKTPQQEGRKQKSIKSLVIDTRLKKEVVKVDETKMKFEKKEKNTSSRSQKTKIY